MPPLLYEQEHVAELQEVNVLARLERMFHEERNNPFNQMLSSTYPVCHTIAVIHTDNAATEIRFERMQDLDVSPVLDDGEFRKDLNARTHIAVSAYPHVKTPFAVHKADDPLGIELHLERTRTSSL